MWLRRRRSPSAGTRAKKAPALARLRMANAERHAELDPTGHWLQRAGTATAAAARATARASSTAVTQAACSCAIRAGDAERSIAPVDGPAPLIADFASFNAVSDPIHCQ